MRGRKPAEILGIVAALVVIATIATLLIGRASSQAASTPPTGDDPTLLLQVRDGDRAVGNVVLVAGAEGAGLLALPPTLLVPTPEPVPLERTPGSPDTLAARDGVTALLGIRVDASVSVDRLALAALIDGTGGVPLDVPERFVERAPDGTPVTIVPAGARVLDGTSAAAYAVVRQAGEAESARTARLLAVVSRVLASLPEQPDAVRAVVLSLGTSARASAPTDAIAGLLGDVRAAAAQGTTAHVLPATTLVAGVSSVPAEPQAGALIATAFPGALVAAGQSPLPRVVLVRAGTSALAGLAAAQALADAGNAVVAVEARGTGEPGTVTIPDWSDRTRARGIAIAAALGLPPTAVRVSAQPVPLPQADAVVVLRPGIG